MGIEKSSGEARVCVCRSAPGLIYEEQKIGHPRVERSCEALGVRRQSFLVVTLALMPGLASCEASLPPPVAAPPRSPRPPAPPKVNAQPKPAPRRGPFPGPTIVKQGHPEPSSSTFLPDGRLVAFTGVEAFIADPRSNEPLRGLRRVPFVGQMRVTAGGAHYVRLGRDEIADVDTTTLADRKTLAVDGMVFGLVPNRDGTRLVATIARGPFVARQAVLVDLGTMREIRTWPVPQFGFAKLSDDDKYVIVNADGTTLFDATTGAVAYRSEGHAIVSGTYAATIQAERGTVTYEHLTTHAKTVTKLPCKRPVETYGTRAAIACDKTLTVFPLVPGAKVTMLEASAPISYVGQDLDHETFYVHQGSGPSLRVEGSQFVPAESDMCVGRTPGGAVAGTGNRMCRATVSPDGQWLTYGGLSLVRASDGTPGLHLPWGHPPTDLRGSVQADVVVTIESMSGAVRGPIVPFDGATGIPKYLAYGRRQKVEVVEGATRRTVAILPLDVDAPQIDGEGDDVIVTGPASYPKTFAKCSLASGTCQNIKGAPCLPDTFANGRGLCVQVEGQETVLTRFVLGAPAETRTLRVPETIDRAFFAGKSWVVTATRGMFPNVTASIARIADASFGTGELEWKEIPIRLQGLSRNIGIGLPLNTPGQLSPPYTVIDLGTAETSRILPYEKGALRMYEDGRVAFFGAREEAEDDVLCIDGDRVLPWSASACKDREVAW